METSFKSITNIGSWRLAAIALSSALAMSVATTAFAVKPNITSPTTATGQVGVTYTAASPLYQITASQPPILSYSTTVSIPGISFDSTTGKFTGTPTTAGSFSGTITATNATGPSNPQNLTVTINPATPVINSPLTASGKQGVSYTASSPLYQITATNNPTSFGASGLPAGLNVNTSTGAITGTPTVNGPFNVTISATNAGGSGSATLVLTIAPPAPTITSAGTASGTWGVAAFAYQITANQTITSYATTVSIPGVSFNTSTGLFSGTPTQLGTFSGNISATNANGTGSKTLTVTINPQTHTAPTSTATISPTAVWEGDTVTLDGSASHTNPGDGSPLIYTWQQQAPNVGILAIALSPNPPKQAIETFTAPAPQPLGTLSWPVTFQLKATDNLVPGNDKNQFSADVTTTVYAKPVADAEPKDAHVNEGTLVTLDGSGSTPQDGMSTLTYTWTAPNGIALLNIHAQKPTFTAPSVGPAGTTLTFSLVVTENRTGLATTKESAPDSMTINVDNVNQPPTAQASTDPNNIVSMAEVDENTDPVTLYGFGSDPDGDGVSFTWTQVHDTTGAPLQGSDTAVVLSDNTSTTPTFAAPPVSTLQQHIDLVFQLTTYDGHLNSGPSYVTIRVNNTNDPPVSNPTVNPLSALEGDLVTLDGSLSSDPNNDPLTYTWAQQTGPGIPVVTPSDIHAAMPTFTAPTVSVAQGSITLTFNLTVSDGDLSDTKPVSITVSHKNLAPFAKAGQAESVPEGSTAYLDGTGSYDPEGDVLTYAWVQLDGPLVGLTPETPDNSKMSFVAPDVGPAGADLHFRLTVTDSHGASNDPANPDATVLIHVSYVNQPPTANAGDEQTVNEGDTVSLAGSGTDPDNNALTFAWSQSNGPAVTITPDPVDSSKATFTAPQVFCAGGVVVITLTVDDGYGGVTTDDVNINVANVNHLPTADAGGNQDVSEGDAVELHGSGDDADTEEVGSLQFQWTQISGLPVVALSGSGKDVGFTAPLIPGGDPNADLPLGFRLTVTDGCGGSTTADKTVRVVNIAHAPTAVAQGPATANEGGDNVTLDGGGSSDPDLDPLTYVWTQTVGPAVTLVYSPGDMGHVMPMFVTPWVSADTQLKFKLTVSDPYGGTSDAYVTVNIINWHTPPNVTNARADVPVLWPPDHKMLPVHILGVVKPSDDNIAITGITQDEPTKGLGDGDTPIDATIHNHHQDVPPADDTVDLRAERSGKGDGRVYRVSFTVADPEQSASGVVKVMVPHDKKTDAAIDSGGTYDSTH